MSAHPEKPMPELEKVRAAKSAGCRADKGEETRALVAARPSATRFTQRHTTRAGKSLNKFWEEHAMGEARRRTLILKAREIRLGETGVA